MRIAEPSITPYQDPLSRIDWHGIDRECWWLPPHALSLAGIAEFEALPLDARRRLSHYEYAHLLEIGLWLEALFVERLARLARRTGDFQRRAQYLQEIREEAGHSLMFVELIRRSGVGLPSARGAGLRLAETLGRCVPSGSALFWAMVVIGEELPNRLTRRLQRGVEDVMLSAVVYRMAQLHGQDEASHAVYARVRCEEATLRLGECQRHGALANTVADTRRVCGLCLFSADSGLPVRWSLARGGVARPRTAQSDTPRSSGRNAASDAGISATHGLARFEPLHGQLSVGSRRRRDRQGV